jgi:hypothetical protein
MPGRRHFMSGAYFFSTGGGSLQNGPLACGTTATSAGSSSEPGSSISHTIRGCLSQQASQFDLQQRRACFGKLLSRANLGKQPGPFWPFGARCFRGFICGAHASRRFGR